MTDTASITEEEKEEFAELIADDLESGALEKAISLFRCNKSLFGLIGRLIQDERMKVRLGVNMLIDELRSEKAEEVQIAIPELLPLLSAENPTLRGDVADLLGMIGNDRHVMYLEPLVNDPNRQVAEIAKDAIQNIKENHRVN